MAADGGGSSRGVLAPTRDKGQRSISEWKGSIYKVAQPLTEEADRAAAVLSNL